MITRTLDFTEDQDIVILMLFVTGRDSWEQIVDVLSRRNTDNAAAYASNLSTIAAEISTYLEQRYDDAGHDTGMKEAAKMRRRVRKALGYTNP